MTEGFSEARLHAEGIDVHVVTEDGVDVIAIRSGGERPEADQGLLLTDGRLYGPGTRRQAMEAARVLPDDADWTVGVFTELRKTATEHTGPL